MSEKKRKRWTRPQLILLARGRPEESVLSICKNEAAKEGPNSAARQCKNWPDDCYSTDYS